jgi:hypothetical protein
MQDNNDQGMFSDLVQSETVLVRCSGCGTDQPVNKVYLPYLNGGIKSCRHCRQSGTNIPSSTN